MTQPAFATPPVYDHIVIVLEENHSLTQIVGNRTDAPYLNALADGGVSFTNFFAITHPSQPNYLEFFSGSNQAVFDDAVPTNGDGSLRYPFSTPNLGAALLAAGRTFTGFSEDLPAAGDRDTSSVNSPTGRSLYRRKHNPWANWQAPRPADDSVPVPPASQLPWTTNQPMSAFPSDFSQLPNVSIVVPNQQNDMHDGTVKMADDWLATHLDAYAQWASAHNSLLIVTWDEDERQSGNRIPTIFYGAHLTPQDNAQTWTLHNLARTIEDMYGLAHAGSAANVQAISGVFTNDFPVARVLISQGSAGYSGTHDTQIRADQPDTSFASSSLLSADLDGGGTGFPSLPLLRFDGLGGGAQVPVGAPILSAKLLLTTGSSAANSDASVTKIALHRMLSAWDETSTWNTLGNGISADGIQATATPSFVLAPNILGAQAIFDVTADVRDWLRNGVPNQGWVLLPAASDGWRFSAAEETNPDLRPVLEIEYAACVLEFSAPTYSRAEAAGGSALITVTRRGWSDGPVSVHYSTADGSATAGADYTAASGTLSWAAGDTSVRTFSVPILTDSLVETDESIALTLSAPTGAALLSSLSSAVLVIGETPLNRWRVDNFGLNAGNPLIAGDAADPDGDGQNNLREFLAGTDPLDAASLLTARLEAGAAGSVHIRFTAQPDRGYTLQFKDALSDAAWQLLAPIAAASQPREMDLTDPIGTHAKRFYRVITP